MKNIIKIIYLIAFVVTVFPENSHAKKCSISLTNCDSIACAAGEGTCTVPELNDYCVVPPFIQEIAKPNLLMIIDNSASMYDLAYVDKGKKHCSVSTSKSCFTDYDCSYCSSTTSTKCSKNSDCPGVETCNVTETCPTTNVDRQPSYCFDETYLSRNTYVGYFERETTAGATQYYYYDFAGGVGANQKFVADSATSITCTPGGAQTLRSIPGQMCVVFNTASPFTVTEFRASGGYLNWLSASKFDVEKEVLTGGKWNGTYLLPESRGCVGQRYIKKAIAKHCSNNTSTSCTTNANCTSGGVCEEFTNFNKKCSNAASTLCTQDSDCPSGGTCPVDTNPPLGIAFGIRGEPDPVNKFAPSPGGYTYIDIFKGDYSNEKCQPAINAISTEGTSQTTWRDSIQTCINYGNTGSYCSGDPALTGCITDSECVFPISGSTGTSGICKKTNGTASTTACYYNTECPNNYPLCIGATPPAVNDYSPCVFPAQPPETKTKIAFVETVQTCWSYVRNGTLGTGDVGRLTSGGKCDDVYKAYGICSLNNNKTCSASSPCGASEGTCTMGPTAILGGNPAFICSPTYLGQYYTGVTPTWSNTWTGTSKHCFSDTTNSIGGACTSDSDCTSSTCQEDAVIQYRRYCNDFNAPNTIDPSDSPSTTATTDNLPAIIGSVGIEGQLGLPIATLNVRIAKGTAPFGLVQEYDNKIRMGVMTFNYNGAYTESGTMYGTAVAIPPQKVCSNTLTAPVPPAVLGTEKSCTSDYDCPTQAAGLCVNAGTNIKDGAKVIAEIGKGKCVDKVTEAPTATDCTTQAHCSSTQKCKSTGVGEHTTATSLVFKIDDIKARAWTPFSEAFYNAIGYFAQDTSDARNSRTALRINSGDFPDDFNPSEYPCQSNNILLITDGMSTADRNGTVNNLATLYGTASGGTQGWTVACTLPFAGSTNFDDMAWLGKHRDIKRFELSGTASVDEPLKKSESINTYIVFNGADNGQAGECNNTTILNQAANKGGTSLHKTDLPEQYEDALRKAFAAVAGGTASGTAASILSNSEGSGANILQAVFYPSKEFETESGQSTPTSAAWIGEMQNLWYFVDPYIGKSSVREDTINDPVNVKALHLVNDYVAEFQFKGGETIAVLKKDSDGDGSGDAIVTTAMDPRVVSQGYCSIALDTKCTTNLGCPSGETCISQSIVNADAINSLWRAGNQLWNRDLSTSPRKLYTHLYGSSATGCTGTFSQNGLVDLANWNSFGTNDQCIIGKLLQAADDDEAVNILKFAQGYDHQNYYNPADNTNPDYTNAINGTIDGNIPRNRSVKTKPSGLTTSKKKVWKLGDVIASTPRIQSFNKLNNFHQDSPAGYADLTYADNNSSSFCVNTSTNISTGVFCNSSGDCQSTEKCSGGKGFANSSNYKKRGMAYAGANDGMLHAFKLGSLSVKASGMTKAHLAGASLGDEQWAFIPKNVLPYLKYLADPAYSHLFLVDGPTRLLDASIGYDDNAYIPAASRTAYSNAGCDAVGSGSHTAYWACKEDTATDGNKSWRTILIGSMGVGGASAENGSSCTNCVKNPIAGVGNSSYFALDITNPDIPLFLWEFSHADMGFATTGAAVARIGHKFEASGITYKDTNGRWFAVVGSGPTGPIDTTFHQFKGKSDNPLHVFVLDLKTGLLQREFTTTINNAFAGAMSTAPIDTDRSKKLSDGFYSDDALYFGYSNCTSDCNTDTPVWNGGIMRLLTDENISPANWSLSTLISNVGPVNTAIGKLQDRKYKNLWLYTGSGRYFFKGDDSIVPGKILAVKEPCYGVGNDDIYSINSINDSASPGYNCTDSITFDASIFNNQTDTINNVDSTKKGWYINLLGADNTNNFGAERIITEPVAMPNGAVFYTSFMPSTDVCNYGGKSYMWGMRYDTGGSASLNQLQGKALVQVSTGSFEEVDLSTALSADFGRKMAAPMIGKPPTDPPPIVSTSGNKPLKRILHIQEK